MANNKIDYYKFNDPNKFFFLIEPDFNKNPKNNLWSRLGTDRRIGLMKDEIHNIEKIEKWQNLTK